MRSLRKKLSFKAFVDSPLAAYSFIGLAFVAVTAVLVFKRLTPVHDAIGWYGAYHYFYDSVARGVFPFWNPYSLAGTPFYPNYQLCGFLEPSNYVAILFQILTGCSTLTTYLAHYLFYYFLF